MEVVTRLTTGRPLSEGGLRGVAKNKRKLLYAGGLQMLILGVVPVPLVSQLARGSNKSYGSRTLQDFSHRRVGIQGIASQGRDRCARQILGLIYGEQRETKATKVAGMLLACSVLSLLGTTRMVMDLVHEWTKNDYMVQVGR
jgi:hypothetical protein